MKFTDQLKGAEQHDYEYERAEKRVYSVLENLGVKNWIKDKGFTVKEWTTMVEILYSSGAMPRAIVSGAIQFGYQLAEEDREEQIKFRE